MSDKPTIIESDDPEPTRVVEQVSSLGTSPMGESFEVLGSTEGAEDILDEDSEASKDHYVLKKITRARLRSPEKFRQKFASLCRLHHDNLCAYRELYVGEKATRITRDFVDGIPLDQYLLKPITDAESTHLAHLGDISEVTEEEKSADDEATPPDSADETDDDVNDDGERADHDDTESPVNSTTKGTSKSSSSPDGRASSPADPTDEEGNEDEPSRPDSLEIPAALLEAPDAADRILDLIILRLHRVIPPLIDALEYLHRFRHIHGNLTPSNILITDDEQVIVTDYGLYPQLEVPADSRQRYPCYHAPEVEDGQYTAKSDLYSLGAILFEIIANCRYGERRRMDTPSNSDDCYSPVYLSEIAPHCPASWVDLIHALLASPPEDRLSLDDVHRQLAATEVRSVNIPATVVQEHETLHGQSESLNQLSDQAQTCSQQRTMGIALVEGETGVGKTALLNALARRAAQRGWVVLHGRFFDRESVAFQGWEDIAARLAEIIDDLPEKIRERLATYRHQSARLFPQLATDTDSRGDVNRQEAVDGLRQLLCGLSEQRPLLICFDDIHWAGRDSTRLLADIVEHPVGMRLMVVASWRPGTTSPSSEHPFWAEMNNAPIDISRVSIEGFSKYEAREYVLTHATHLSLRQKQKVLRRGGLNPLLIDELIYELDETAEPAPVDSGEAIESAAVKTSAPQGDDHFLRSFIEQRLNELSRSERLVIQLLAVASAPLSAFLLAVAMKRELGAQTSDFVTGREVAESLVERRLARRTRRVDPASDESAPYVIVHDLCRRVVLDELGHDHHARLCGLVADALAEQDQPTDDLRFEYLLRAGRDEEASRVAKTVARTALERFAYHRSALLWQWLTESEASQVSGLSDEERDHYAQALFGAGRFASAISQLDQLPQSSSASTTASRHRQRVRGQLSLGDRQAAVDALDDALSSMASHPYCDRSILNWPGDLRRRVSATIGRWSDATAIATEDSPDDDQAAVAHLVDFSLQAGPFLISEAQRSLEHRFASIALQQQSSDLLARDRLWMIGPPWLPFLVRDGNKLDRWAKQAATLCEPIDDPEARARTLEIKALLHRHRGELEACADSIDQGWQQLQHGAICNAMLRARLQMLRVDHALWLGDIESVATIVDQSIHHFRHHRWLSVLALLARCHRDLLVGALDNAHRGIDEIEDFFGESRDCLAHLWMMDCRTRFNIARGRPEVAVAQWDLLLDRAYGRSLRRLPSARYLIHLNLARSLAALAQRQSTLEEVHRRESIRRLRRSLRRLGDLEDWLGALERAQLERLRCCYALIEDRAQRALRHAEEAIDIFDDPPPVVEAMNREALGFVQLRLEHPDARSTLEQARATYQRCGVYLPLVLEGWPVPRSHARLREDPE